MSGSKRKAGAASARSAPLGISGLEESPQVDFALRRHPQETMVDRLHREHCRTSGEMSVSILKTFLSRKLSYEPSSHFQILANAGGKGVILDDAITMTEARRDICDIPDGLFMVLHYRIMPINY